MGTSTFDNGSKSFPSRKMFRAKGGSECDQTAVKIAKLDLEDKR
jgi:hypothetical protein